MRGCACRGTAGFAHVSCLAEQANILVTEAEENNLDSKVFNERWRRWDACSLCEQEYHGAVRCALGWACWKTYLGRPEADDLRGMAIGTLGNGLSEAGHDEDALSVREAELAMARRIGTDEEGLLTTQSNLANTYRALGRFEEALSLRRDVYSATLNLFGSDDGDALLEANNYGNCLLQLKRFEEVRALSRKMIPVARRVLGENDDLTLRMRWIYAQSLYLDDDATLDDLREAVSTLEEIERTARRVMGGAHPLTLTFERDLRDARAVLRAREAPSPGAA